MTVSKQRIAPLKYSRMLLSGSDGVAEAFEAAMRARLGADVTVTPLGRARSGIYLLTKYAVAQGRRKVLLSPYTIPDVVNMVLLAGGVPEFFDFLPRSTACDVEALASRLDDETACVWITHYHVNEPRLAEIAALCHRAGALLFNDCALAFGGAIGGRPVGSLTDGAVFSFSGFKLLNFIWGGVVAVRAPSLQAWIDKETQDWIPLRAGDYARPAQALLKYDLATRPIVFDAMVFPLLKQRGARPGAVKALEFVRIENETLNSSLTSKPSRAAFSEWNSKLPNIDLILSRRRGIVQIYREKLAKFMLSAEHTSGENMSGNCYVNFPVFLGGVTQDAIAQAMTRDGFDVGLNLYPNCHNHPKFKDFPGKSSNVETLVHSTIYLPTHFGVRPEYAARLATALASRLSEKVR